MSFKYVLLFLMTTFSGYSAINKLIRRVAIIGAGASGLVTGHVLHENGFEITIFEQNSNVGGVWNYNESEVMYRTLRTNLPKEIMAFSRQHPFPSGVSYVGFKDVQDYLIDFYLKSELYQRVMFKKKVQLIRKDNQSDTWIVCYCDISKNEIETKSFDAVLVCSGHFDKPNFPSITGLNNFKGSVYHSKDYDQLGDKFEDKIVLVIGSKSSGTDMAREISKRAKSVIISDHNYIQTGEAKHGNIFLKGGLSQVDSIGNIKFQDGTTYSEPIDIILMCTGYQYAYPFLPDHITQYLEVGKRFRGLYQQLFWIEDPTIVFIGLPFSVVPFPLFYFQAKWIEAIYSNRVQLPSREYQKEWLQSFETKSIASGAFQDKYHFFRDEQFDYFRQLARWSQIFDEETSKYIDLLEAIYLDNSNHKPLYTGGDDSYRNRNYIIDR